jgi:hypothetical protein
MRLVLLQDLDNQANISGAIVEATFGFQAAASKRMGVPIRNEALRTGTKTKHRMSRRRNIGGLQPGNIFADHKQTMLIFTIVTIIFVCADPASPSNKQNLEGLSSN